MTPVSRDDGWVAQDFVSRVLAQQALVGVLAFATLGLLVPWALMLESAVLTDLALRGAVVAVASVAITGVLSARHMRDARRVLRALTVDLSAVEPENIGALADLPFALTLRFLWVGLGAAVVFGAPGLRPEQLDEARAVSLSLLTLTIVSASAMVHYVVVRESILRVVELSPLEPITAWLERESLRAEPEHRVTRRVLLAVVTPVTLVGIGTMLVTHAHQRAFVERSRKATAVMIARAALDASPNAAGRDDALAAAAAHGINVKLERASKLPTDAGAVRLRGGQLETFAALDDGRARLRYSAELAPEVITTPLVLALLAAGLASIVGLLIGRALTADLVLATRQVARLGTDTVLRGEARVAGPARFRLVEQLGRSIEGVAERFRTFASAQERTIEAKESAQRMKQLLFASVSHDLKSPLNAILGFAELVRMDPLTRAQLESLDMVSGRGRELLALIETILDAARVEAGQLELDPVAVPTDKVLQDALDTALDLRGGVEASVMVEMMAGMPPLRLDARYGPRAIAVLIHHAMEAITPKNNRTVRVIATLAATEDGAEPVACVQVEYAALSNRASLLEAQLRGQSPTRMGRGTALRLNLARTILELHGGRVEVERGAQGTGLVTCWLPTAPAV